MTVLVTGGAGYIGSHMVHALRDNGIEVIVLDDLSSGNADAVPLDVELVTGSCGDTTLVLDIMQRRSVTSVIHFAGSTVVPESMSDPIKYYQNNVGNLIGLLKATLQAKITNFIFSSTAAVYGPVCDDAVKENATLAPESPYGHSKLMGEQIIRDAGAAHDLSFAIFRYFNVAGADPLGRVGQSTPNATHLIKLACQAAINGNGQFSLFGADYPTFDGTCVRDFIHVSDLVDAHLLALKYLKTGGKSVTLNCGYGQGYSVREVLDAIQKISGENFDIVISPRRAGDTVISIADGTLLRSLGWYPKYESLETIVSHALKWERKLKGLN
jgi:UDP-glucose 4-epimerase